MANRQGQNTAPDIEPVRPGVVKRRRRKAVPGVQPGIEKIQKGTQDDIKLRRGPMRTPAGGTPELEDMTTENLSKEELAFFNYIMDEPGKLRYGPFVETEISGGEDAQPDLSDFKNLTNEGQSLKPLLGQNIFNEEIIKSLRRIKGLDVNQFIENFEKFLIEMFIKCDKGKKMNASTLTQELAKYRKQEFTSTFNQLPPRQLYKIFDQSVLRIAILFQKKDWDPEDPGVKEENYFHGWTTTFKNLFAEYLINKEVIGDKNDVVMFNTSGTPADYLAEADSFFCITKGKFKGLTFGIDYTVDPHKPKKRRTGRRFHVHADMHEKLIRTCERQDMRDGKKELLEQIQMELVRKKQKNAHPRTTQQKNEKTVKAICKSLITLRNKIYREVFFERGFKEYIQGVEEDMNNDVKKMGKNQKLKSSSPRYIADIDGLLAKLDELKKNR